MNKATKKTPREGKPVNHNQKRSPERMKLFLELLMEWPNVRRASKLSGVSRHLPRYWKEQSARGPKDGEFAVTMGEGEDAVTKEFHEWWGECIGHGADRVEEEYQDKALGYWEDVIHDGKRCYEIDPKKPYKIEKGVLVPNYRKDENGELVPLRVWKKSESAQHNLLKAYKPSQFRENFKVDASVNHTGGAFFVPAKALNEAEFLAMGEAANEEAEREAAERKERGED